MFDFINKTNLKKAGKVVGEASFYVLLGAVLYHAGQALLADKGIEVPEIV